MLLAYLLAMEIIGRKKFNEKESTFISFLYLLLNAGTKLGIAIVYGEPYWPFYISALGWCFCPTYYLVNRWRQRTDNQ